MDPKQSHRARGNASRRYSNYPSYRGIPQANSGANLGDRSRRTSAADATASWRDSFMPGTLNLAGAAVIDRVPRQSGRHAHAGVRLTESRTYVGAAHSPRICKMEDNGQRFRALSLRCTSQPQELMCDLDVYGFQHRDSVSTSGIMTYMPRLGAHWATSTMSSSSGSGRKSLQPRSAGAGSARATHLLRHATDSRQVAARLLPTLAGWTRGNESETRGPRGVPEVLQRIRLEATIESVSGVSGSPERRGFQSGSASRLSLGQRLV